MTTGEVWQAHPLAAPWTAADDARIAEAFAACGVVDPEVVGAAQTRARLAVDEWQARRVAWLEALGRLPADPVLWYAAQCVRRGPVVVVDDDGEAVQ